MKHMMVMLVLGAIALSFADAPIYGYFWLRYTYENPTQPEDVTSNANYFSIDRGYIRWKTSTSPVAFSGTIDISQASGATNKSDWNVRLKYAQADWTLPYVGNTLPDAKLILGLQKVYFGYIDRWEYAVLEKALEDTEKKMNSADLGAGFYTLLPGGYGELSAQVFNGLGYSSVTENNAYKALCGNLSILPITGVMLKGSYWMSKKSVGDTIITQVDEIRYAGVLQIKYGPVILVGEYLGSTDDDLKGMGYMGCLEFKINKRFGLAGRYDYWDGDTDADNNGHNRITGGINWNVSSALLTQLNYQIKQYEDDTRDPSDKVILQFKYSY